MFYSKILFDSLRKYNKLTIPFILQFEYDGIKLLRHRGNVKYYIRPFSLDVFIAKEIFDIEIYHVHIKPNDTVLDCGAEIGLFSLYSADKGASVTAFEPVKSSYELFYLNRGINPSLYNNITIVPLPISYKSERRMFYYTRNRCNSSFTPYSLYSDNKLIQTIDINTYLPCDILKVDIEGFEYELLANINLNLIKKEISLEYHTQGNLKSKLPTLLNQIKSSGFKIDNFEEFGLNGYLHAMRVS